MTGYELRDRVCALGFNSELPDDGSFFQSANQALERMRNIIPLVALTTVNVGTEVYDGLGVIDMSKKSLEGEFIGVKAIHGTDRYTVRNHLLYLPVSDNSYTVEYIYRPEPLSEDNMGDPLGVDASLDEAAALMTAYYVWMEDDADKAEAYRKEAEYAIAHILQHRQISSSRVVTNNW